MLIVRVMLWVPKVRNSANPSELQVLQRINKKMFLTPARIGLTSPQLSCKANWGGRSWAFWNFTKLLLRCHWACALTGRSGKWMQTTQKSNNSKKIRTISRVKPLSIFFIFVSRTIQSYLDCILLEYSSLSWCTRDQMFYQSEGNETLSYNSHIFICIPSEPQLKMKGFNSYSSLRVDFLLRVIFTCLRALNLRGYIK